MTIENTIKSIIGLMSIAGISFLIVGATCSADFGDNGPPDRAALDAAFESCGISKPSPGNPPLSLSEAQVQCMTSAGFPPPAHPPLGEGHPVPAGNPDGA